MLYYNTRGKLNINEKMRGNEKSRKLDAAQISLNENYK